MPGPFGMSFEVLLDDSNVLRIILQYLGVQLGRRYVLWKLSRCRQVCAAPKLLRAQVSRRRSVSDF